MWCFSITGDMAVDNLDGLKRQPFNDQNPDGPLEMCTCATCGTPIMLDDKERRIRVIVPNLMGYDPDSLPATYHAFYDPASGAPEPTDGRSVYEGLRPDFVWARVSLKSISIDATPRPANVRSGSILLIKSVGDGVGGPLFPIADFLLPPPVDTGAVFVFLVGVFGVPAWRSRCFPDGWRYSGELGQASQVLNGCRQEELVVGAGEPPEP